MAAIGRRYVGKGLPMAAGFVTAGYVLRPNKWVYLWHSRIKIPGRFMISAPPIVIARVKATDCQKVSLFSGHIFFNTIILVARRIARPMPCA